MTSTQGTAMQRLIDAQPAEIAFARLHDLMQKGFAVSNTGQRDHFRLEHPTGSAVIVYPNGFCDVRFSPSFADIHAQDHQAFREFLDTVPRATWWMRARRLGNDLTDGLILLAILCVLTTVMIGAPIMAVWSLLYYSAHLLGLEAWIGKPLVLDWFGLFSESAHAC